MEIELYKTLDLDLRISKLNKNFQLSDEFTNYHNIFVRTLNPANYFTLSSEINVNRKDQLLLNIQYNNLLYSLNVYRYDDYVRYAEEFFTYFLNYEITTRRGSPSFPVIVRSIFDILNRFDDKL